MDAISGVADRIGQIQQRIAQLSPQPSSSTAFAAALSQAVVAQGAGPARAVATAFPGALPGASALAAPPAPSLVGTGAGAVDAKGIPLALKTYGNGRVPAEALSRIDGGDHRLWEPAARSFEAMRDAARRDGVTIGITDSYRSYDAQVDVARRKGLYSQGGLAAVPGTSNHGWGLALDLRLDATAQAWMRANAKDYGFVEDVPREPWHWTYRPTR